MGRGSTCCAKSDSQCGSACFCSTSSQTFKERSPIIIVSTTEMHFFAALLPRFNIQLVECVVKRNKGGQRSNSSSTCVQIRQFRRAKYHWSSQHWNYRAAHERLMAQQLLFSLSCIYASRSGNSIYNHHSYVEDFFFNSSWGSGSVKSHSAAASCGSTDAVAVTIIYLQLHMFG